MNSYPYSVCLIIFALIRTATALASPNRRVSIVTGANGYLGREIVHNLLGSRVSTGSDKTSTSSSCTNKVLCLVRQRRVEEEEKYWKSFAVNEDSSSSSRRCQVQVMPYDMLDGGKTLSDALNYAFEDSKNGADDSGVECCVYHVASVFSKVDDHRQMALDNVKGSEDVIKTVGRLSSINTRVVLTSSMAAVRGPGQTPLNGKFYTHEDWNNVSELGRDWGSSYQWSKAESEKRALKLAEQNGVQFVAICPSFIFGPPAHGSVSKSFSLSLVRSWIRGESPVQSRLCVDVRDVARAHFLAGTAETVEAKRIVVSREARISSREIADDLKRIARDTGLGVPDGIYCDEVFDGGAVKIGEKEVECVERTKALLGGLEFRSTKETMVDMAAVLLDMDKEDVP